MTFKQYVVLCNPVSTRAVQAAKRVEALKQLVGADKVRVIETSPNGRAANRQLLQTHRTLFGSETLLCVAAGDGTLNLAAEVLTEAGSPVSQTVILPLWGGNANDVAHMLNGPAYRISMANLLKRGRVVAVHPISCKLTDTTGHVQQRLAIGYVGFGATALAARQLNGAMFRSSDLHKVPGGRFVQEWTTVLRTLHSAPPFTIEEKRRKRHIYERMFLNGSRIAKLRPLPLRLTDTGFYVVTYDENTLAAALNQAREFFQDPESKKAPARTTFRCVDAAWAQFDGETVQLAPDTTVEITQSAMPIRALSIRLGAA